MFQTPMCRTWAFIDDKLTDDGQTTVDTLIKTSWARWAEGLWVTRRMVQIYLLCLVRDGRVVTVGARWACHPHARLSK